MERKFLKIVENTISRYSNGGFLTGDVVKLVSNYKSKDSFKNLPDDVKEYITSYFDTDMNYRVINIKTGQATGGGAGPADNANRGTEFNVEVAQDQGGGRYDLQGKVTLSADLLTKVESADGMFDSPKVPDSVVGNNKEQIKPKEVSEDEELTVNRVTSKGNLGDPATPTELSLPKSNTKIPSSAATASPAVGDTAKYMS